MKKFILDTKILLRFFTKDNPKAFAKSKKILETITRQEVETYLSIIVIHEFMYLMDRQYKIQRSEYIDGLITLINWNMINILEISKSRVIEILLSSKKTTIDFTDLYLCFRALKENCEVVTFDNDFKKLPVKVHKQK
ncbi:PIN domain-containing protein [Candidatus Woesebacteria bacterium]|nr:PIN domain-containing protein [Candidatus Woesebacteria bacterium]